jgi:hypothetical protein
MPRITEATHAMLHPGRKDTVLLMRGTVNPIDPPGVFGVLKEITLSGFKKHYEKQCLWVAQRSDDTIYNNSGHIDAVIFKQGSIVEQSAAHRRTVIGDPRPSTSEPAATDEEQKAFESAGVPVNRADPALVSIARHNAHRMSKEAITADSREEKPKSGDVEADDPDIEGLDGVPEEEGDGQLGEPEEPSPVQSQAFVRPSPKQPGPSAPVVRPLKPSYRESTKDDAATRDVLDRFFSQFE